MRPSRISGARFDAGSTPSASSALRWAINVLHGAGVDNPAFDAQTLLRSAAKIDSVEVIRNPQLTLAPAAIELFELYVKRRLAREPVSRILGRRGFWSFDLEVSPDVLDPRPDTETLVYEAIERLAGRENAALRILDLGTGSGALLCALLDCFPNATGVGVEISAAACRVAKNNLLACGFGNRAEIRVGTWGAGATEKFDAVVSNPPYIASAEIERLDPEVRLFDPLLSLDGGEDGLRAYREIVTLLPILLSAAGVAIFEIGHTQAQAVSDILSTAGLKGNPVRSDFGGNPRVISATYVL